MGESTCKNCGAILRGDVIYDDYFEETFCDGGCHEDYVVANFEQVYELWAEMHTSVEDSDE